jgi:ketosteroid isomerase-like protein
MKLFTALAVAAAFGALAACGDAASKRPTAAQDVAAIMEFNKHYLGAINDGDIKTLAALTTDGHVMIAPNRPPIVGKAANDAMNGRAFEQFQFDESWSPTQTVVSGDLAFQQGTYVSTAKPRAGGESRTIHGSFLRIYQRQPNGEWRMTRDTFNSEPPADSASSAPTN